MGATLKIPISQFDHRIGRMDASVVMVEYGDFQCPYCAVTAPVIETLLDEFRDDLCFVYRHFPMRNIHPVAELSALAGEAADQQGKFWEMHKLLFRNSASLNSEYIGLLARSLNLDMDRFLYDVQRNDLIYRVHQDFNGGLRSGVNSTPTLFLNGERYEDSSTYEPLSMAIRDILEGSGASAFF